VLAATLADYELFIYALQDEYASIRLSTLTVIHQASDVATVEGDVSFHNGLSLRVLEVVRFDVTPPRLARYGYKVRRGIEKLSLYWYDSQPHPNDPVLAATDPHHKHIPPDIKHHRVPAPHMSFTRPNLPALIEEIERLA